MADDPNSTKPRLPDHARAGSTSRAPRLAPTDPRWWPEDPYGLTFLARFVDQIGFRVFADWTGTEVNLSEAYLLPERVEADDGDRIIASLVLREHRPDLGQQDFRSPPWSAADNARRHELWRLAQQLAECEYNALPRRRLRCIRAEIWRQSCAGELTLKIRHVLGGPFETFQPVWWNRDNPNELFARCIIDPKYPFGGRPSWKPNTDSWIFAPREGIDQIAARLTATPEAEPQLPRISVDPQKPPVREPITESDLDEPTSEAAPTAAEQPDQPQSMWEAQRPAPAPAANASVPGANTESSVAKPTAQAESEPAPPTEPPPIGRQASDAAVRKAIGEIPEEWFVERGRSETEIRKRIEQLAEGAVSRDRLRCALKAGVPALKKRGRGRPRNK